MREQLLRWFADVFQTQSTETRLFYAPGRVNLIGEHIDYNGGYVLPCALDIGTYALVRTRADQQVNMYSVNFAEQGIVSFSLQDVCFEQAHGWANYPKGIIHALQRIYTIPSGIDILYYGNIPNGAGLSSSASIELVTATMLDQLFSLQAERLALVQLSQQAENQFIGMNCGIMDQFAVGMGKKNQAMLLNCDTLDYRYLPVELHDCSIVIANTNKQRTLASSAYNERRATCEQALATLQQHLPIATLADLSVELFEQYRKWLSPVEEKRTRHVVTENDRTKQAVAILEQGDLRGFGQLMQQSHLSLRDDYEVTGVELDTLVEVAWQHPGTIGARMTGAGFGGCTVNIVENEQIPAFIQQVGREYEAKIGYPADFYIVNVGDGAKELTEEE